ncbi:MAG TPA: response regulator transcription factor [Drouetiella sp.]
MSKVLLVEDDESMAKPLTEWLQSNGFRLEWTTSAEDAMQLLTNFQYDLIVLDKHLPGMSGKAMLNKYRAGGGMTPILMLTGDATLSSKMDGLDSGADDYLTKPFEPEELAARIRAILRRPAELLPDILIIGNVELNSRTQKVTLNGKELTLARGEYAVLAYLMRNPNRCFSSQELLRAVWSADSGGGEDAVRSCFKRLRKKLTDEDGNCLISTVHGAGYTIET